MIRDTLTYLDLSVYPEIALVLFVGVFLTVAARALRRGGAPEARRAAAMPLRDGDTDRSTTAERRGLRGVE